MLIVLLVVEGEIMEKQLTAEEIKKLRETPRLVAPDKSRGLGDTVAKVIHAVSGGKIKPCGGCKRRQAKLNKLVPYKQD